LKAHGSENWRHLPPGEPKRLENRNIEGGHPHFVLSDTSVDPDRVVVASLTQWHKSKDQSCVLRAGEDSIVQKTSVVSYRDAKVVDNAFLDEQLAAGVLVAEQPLKSATIQKIRDGCAVTRQIPNDAFEMLDQQGLIPLF
jgi:hypothetical protein